MQQQYRHGDLLLIQIDAEPQEIRDEKKDGILAEGEVTGHNHRIHRGDLQSGSTKVGYMNAPRKIDEWDELFVSIQQQARLIHQEHSTITIPRGTYKVVRQREFAASEVRRVMD